MTIVIKQNPINYALVVFMFELIILIRNIYLLIFAVAYLKKRIQTLNILTIAWLNYYSKDFCQE